MRGDEARAIDGVEGKLRNQKLSEAEKKGIRIITQLTSSSATGKLKAVGKLLSDRPAKAEHVSRTLREVWCPFTGVDCKELGRNRFLFSFHDEAGKRKALNNGPWRFNKELLVMEDFTPSKTIDEYEFKKIPIWVRAYDVPLGAMCRETGELIGKQVGEVLDVDLDENDSAMGEYMRIKVRIDITSPLMRFFTLIIDEEEEYEQEREEMEEEESDVEKKKKEKTKVITFRYEHLPDFCYNCEIIGHNERACPTKGAKAEGRQFGAWMRAVIFKGGSSEEGRSKSSSDRSNFWRSNSAGSKGSDGPSWRKNLSSTEGDEKINRGEGGDTSPLKITLDDQTKVTGGKKLVYDERNSESFSKKEHKEGFESEVTNEATVQSCQRGDSERAHDGRGKNVQSEEKENMVVQKSETNEKHNTFIRVKKPKGKQHSVPVVVGTKKRIAEYMEFDDEVEFFKKARMEVDGEEEEEASAKQVAEGKRPEGGSAGLQGQPGESK
nr:uncharacterized protein LOC123494088 [Aegilops tauschii subsp. strangulata]